MLCTHCDARNADNARFCSTCGVPLHAAPVTGHTTPLPMSAPVMQMPLPANPPACPQCQRANPLGARFCVFCATPLTSHGQSALQHVSVNGLTASVTAGVTQMQWVLGPALMSTGPNILLRGIWFVLVGWWLGLIWTLLAWAFNLSVILLPLGVWMLNRVPRVMTLRTAPPPHTVMVNGTLWARQANRVPWVLRAGWFVFIGWWASLLWMLTAWGLSVTLILLPLAFWMFNRVPTITTLATE